ncbi:MAG: tRNA (N6-threonylcarbamoyladenosine(37)-N6)-methyltransferase TrmO [Proteobacteria bacterium]|nr:tRNA (N6-threonylcarbamoyladenosine(37)-N6)-methyltransferase TrmO [Pseudomonadota bacterium]
MKPIGIIHSPFTDIENMPIQPKGASDVEGTITLYEPYVKGLDDLDGFSHIYLLYLFHKADKVRLSVIPFMDTKERGVFATRSPLRPNHIGISIVQLTGINGPVLSVRGIDVLDGTPLLDIKPYIENFDLVKNSRSGWMMASHKDVSRKRSDDRFR